MKLLEIYTKNYYTTKEQSARFGEAMVPVHIKNNLEEFEKNVATTTEQLAQAISDVYSNSSKLINASSKMTEIEEGEISGKGLLDYQVEGIEAMEQVSKLTRNFTEAMNVLSEQMRGHTQRLNNLPQENKVKQAQVIAINTANDINTLSKIASEYQSNSLQQIRIYKNSVSELLSWVSIQPDKNSSDLENFRDSVITLYTASDGALDSILTFRESVINLRQRNINRALNNACNRLSNVLSKITEMLEELVSFGQGFEETINDILDN